MLTPAKAQIVIFSRPGCHLCDEAKLAIEGAQCRDKYTLEEINIESDPDLLRRYQYDIPVITINGVEAFRHRLTAEAFRQRLQTASGASPPSQPRADCNWNSTRCREAFEGWLQHQLESLTGQEGWLAPAEEAFRFN